MKQKQQSLRRRGSVLVEYALVVAGIVITAAVAVAVTGHKVQHILGVMAAILPGAHADDNQPVSHSEPIPFTNDGNGKLILDTPNLVNSQGGVERFQGVLGAGGGELLVSDQ